MATATSPAVVVRAAAGPRLGYGHLVRATALARELSLPAVLSLRGGAAAAAVATRLGWTLASGHVDAISAEAARLLVIDDPSGTHASRWRTAAGRRRVPVLSIHDLGLAACGADVAVDGSVVRPPGVFPPGSLLGPRYLILGRTRARWREPRPPAVLIALGGGPRAALTLRLARRLRAARPDVRVRVAGGMSGTAPAGLPAGVTWLGPQSGLSRELSRASVAIVGGGITLYEACRVGTPAIAVAVVPAQTPTIEGVVAAGAALAGGTARDADHTVRQAAGLLEDEARRARMSRLGRALVDGRGAARVAERLSRLARTGTPHGDARRSR